MRQCWLNAGPASPALALLLRHCWLKADLQHWPAIEAVLAECWSGFSSTDPLLRQCWLNAGPAFRALAAIEIEAVLAECWSGISSTSPLLRQCWSGISSNCPLLSQCWLNAGPASPALARYWGSTGPLLRQCWLNAAPESPALSRYWGNAGRLLISSTGPQLRQCWLNAAPSSPALARYWGSAGWMLVRHLQHWPGIETIEAVLAECWSVFSSTGQLLRQCWPSIEATLAEPWPAIKVLAFDRAFLSVGHYWSSTAWMLAQPLHSSWITLLNIVRHPQRWLAIVLFQHLQHCPNACPSSPGLTRYWGIAGWMLAQPLHLWSLLKQHCPNVGPASAAMPHYWDMAESWPTYRKIDIVGSLHDRKVAFTASNRHSFILQPMYFSKAAPWDDINFRFYFCNEVVYHPDHDFMFFRVFRFFKIFYINISN